MADNTLTISLGGTLGLEAFVEAISCFGQLVQALSDEVSSSDPIDWIMADLNYGSATATIGGVSRTQRPDSVSRVIEAYAAVGGALERGQEPPYSHRVVRSARRLASLADSKVTVIRFVTAAAEAEIRQQPAMIIPFGLRRIAHGIIEGRVQTLTDNRGLRFVLYEAETNKPVSCYLREDDRETMREAWGKKALVEGLISRDRMTGTPVAIRSVTSVKVVPDTDRWAYQLARGVLPRIAGEIAPEDRIRATRDVQ